jgi:hypothetical protein
VDSGVCLPHNVLKGTKYNTLFLKLDLLPFSQEMLGGFYSTGSLRMAFSQYLCVHRVVKVKVKFTLEQVRKARRGSRGIALLFL